MERLRIEIVTLFPGYFEGPLRESILGRGAQKELYDIHIINLRDFGLGKHRVVDDAPFGGGGGMALMLEPLSACLESLDWKMKQSHDTKIPRAKRGEKLLLTSAAGRPLTQSQVVEWSLLSRLTIVCGHYVGVDERILQLFDMQEMSIGDYTLTGGEPAAAVVVDAVCRLRPGALGNFSSALADSHQEEILGAPVYTRPETFAGLTVPNELLCGDHKKIARYRRESALCKTAQKRPDILRRTRVKNELSVSEIEKIAHARVGRGAKSSATNARVKKNK